MKCIATICSKKKDENTELLPAHLRYLAPHVEQTYNKAEGSNLPFYILSGKYGLIGGEEQIPYYDYYLEADKVEELSIKVAEQIEKEGITDMDFYFEDKESWAPYISTLEKATKQAGCALNKVLFA
jgi:hypothetical protein